METMVAAMETEGETPVAAMEVDVAEAAGCVAAGESRLRAWKRGVRSKILAGVTDDR